jgi:hypothetical protein
MKYTILFAALLSSAALAAGELPDLKATPGAINPDVTQANIHKTICVSGWTKTIRPPSTYTTKLKIQQLRGAGLRGEASDYEEDHLISLELGGHPTSPANLWPQPWVTSSGWDAHKKDVIETRLKRMVCAGKISLADAQKEIATNWMDAYRKYVPSKK